jgi:DNA-binding GntR family transcriptional regulator
MNADAQRVKRQGNSASLVYDQIRADILTGKLTPGSPLSQLGLAKLYGMSRGPVREALQRLQQDQLIIGSANRKFSVAGFDLADLESLLILQLANVALAIQISVPSLMKEDFAALDNAIERMEASIVNDTAEWEEAYKAFVMAITRNAGNKVVLLIADLADNIQRFRVNILERFPRVYARTNDFKLVVEASRNGNASLAAQIFAEFFGRHSSLILAGASPSYDSARLRGYIQALLPETN